MTPSDDELVDRANRGDAGAFELLYERHRAWVIALALRFVGDADLAHDVCHDTFLYLLGKFPGFVLTAQLKTFLYPAVRHNAMALRRAQQRRLGTRDLHDVEVKAPEMNDQDSVLAEVAKLSESHREVLILRYVDDLALADIARALDVPLGTVKSRLHLALARLRGGDEACEA